MNQALQSLPHGPEFRFVQELVELEPGKSGKATYTISGDEAFLAGHFPNRPMWPGVIMIEAIAQLGGVVAQSDPEHPQLHDVRLTAVKNAKILGTARPGSTLTVHAKVEGRLTTLIQVSGSVFVDDILLASAIITLSGV